MKCERCESDKEAEFRVISDVLDIMSLCKRRTGLSGPVRSVRHALMKASRSALT